MGQQCSCLQHPARKYQRRPSDANASVSDEDESDQELHILIDAHREGDAAADDALRRVGGAGKAVALAGDGTGEEHKEEEEEEQRLMLDSLGRGLLGDAEDSQQVLRSYQAATGMVDPGELDLECIMCLDTFSTENPKMRTLCNCGMNRTNFHLSCLLEWTNRDANCPVCRAYLYYEDM